MNALFQRLKELDSNTFEELSFQIWSERLPGAGLRRVEGKAGDKGIDVFAGRLSGKPAIWQCKFFKDGIRDAQKKQIKHSLKVALKNFKPATWTLCVPINLDISAHKWFQELTRRHSSKVKIELFDASQIVKELIFRPPVRNAFFPGALLEVNEIRSTLLGTGRYSDAELGARADETVEQYVERLRKKEPRYDYRVSYDSGNSGVAQLNGSFRTLPPNTVMSMWQGNRRLDLTVRDVDAFRKDPPTITLRVNAEGAQKLQQALHNGLPVELGHDELVSFRSSFDYLTSPEEPTKPYQLLLTPRLRTLRESFRVTFSAATEKVVYELIDFDISTRSKNGPGSQRIIVFSSVSEHVPFEMRLMYGLDDRSFDFQMESSFFGHDILEIQKFFAAMRVLRSGGKLELFDLKREMVLGPITVELTSISENRESLEQVTDALAEVSRAFGQKLMAPEVIDKKDLDVLSFLLQVSRTGEVMGATVHNLTASLVRREEPPDAVLAPVAGDIMVGLENETYPLQHLLDADIQLGPNRAIIEHATIRDFERVKKEYAALQIGETMPIAFDCAGPVRQVFYSFYKGPPLDPLIQI